MSAPLTDKKICLLILSHSKYIGQIYTDSLVHNEEALQYLIKTIGENNVILGSDYPFPLGEHHPGKLIENMECLSDDVKVRKGIFFCFYFILIKNDFLDNSVG